MISIAGGGRDCQEADWPAKVGPAAQAMGIHSLVCRIPALVLRALCGRFRRLPRSSHPGAVVHRGSASGMPHGRAAMHRGYMTPVMPPVKPAVHRGHMAPVMPEAIHTAMPLDVSIASTMPAAVSVEAPAHVVAGSVTAMPVKGLVAAGGSEHRFVLHRLVGAGRGPSALGTHVGCQRAERGRKQE
jgi:hypothetical protein